MTHIQKLKTGLAIAALASFGAATLATAPAIAAPAQSAAKADKPIILSIGRGEQVNLPTAITDVFVADDSIADVDVKSSRQIYLIGKGPGETTVYATDASGRTVYSATVRVGNNLDSVDQMLKLAMPESDIQVTTLNGVVLLTGTVAQPEDATEARDLTESIVGDKFKVVSRLRNATPLQVNLQVRIAEVSRSLAKEINGNLATRDNDGNNFILGAQRGRDFVDIGDLDTSGLPQLDASALFGLPAGSISLPFNPATGQFVTGGTQFNFKNVAGGNVIQAAGRLFGLDVAAAFDLSEKAGLVSTLANPNLTTVSGETADFLAGGSFPILTSSNNGTSVEYRDYGVSLTYTPTVLSDGRISLRIRSEVSDISSQGAVRIGGIEVPATTNRMAETTVELGSGQSIMIAGLLSNTLGSSIDKMPGAGDLPIIGALFKSNGWRRNETELMIVITPYLVKPVSDSEIRLPTDGLHSPTDLERILLNKTISNKGDGRPMPTVAPEGATGPGIGSSNATIPAPAGKAEIKSAAAEGPGFSFDQ